MRVQVAVSTAALILGCAAIGFPPPALSADQNSQSPAAVEAQPAPAEEAPARKVVVKRKKARKKGRKPAQAAAVEVTPGDRLTVKQVLEVMKTTRDLSGKNLSGLQLVGVNLSKGNLKGADLSHANLERADLSESNLERADLSGANLRMASLHQAGMTAANLELVTLDGAIWKDGSVCARGSIGQCRIASALPPASPSATAPASAAPAPSDSRP